MKSRDNFEKAKKTFRSRGGVLRMNEALQAGIHRRMLYSMLEAGVIEQLNRGLYRLTDLPPLGNPDLVSVSLKVPTSVICLISALSYHEITTQIGLSRLSLGWERLLSRSSFHNTSASTQGLC